MAALASLIGMLVALPSGWWPAPHLVLSAMGAVFLITGAGNAINDVYDVEIDKVNRPTRPLPSGKIARRGAILTSLTLFLTGIAASLYIAVAVGFLGCFALALFNSVLLVEYARRLKRTALYGNLAVAYLTASTFLYGAAMLGQSTSGDVVVLVLLAFLATLARELIKDVEDIQGDEALGASTLPILMGKRWAVGIALTCIVLAVALSPLPMLEGFGGLGENYLWVVAGADAGFLVSALLLLRDKPSSASKGVKLSMMLALVAFMAGSIG